MASKVSIRQNAIEQLDCLAAQRHLYSKAKTVAGVRFFLAVLAIVAISIVTPLAASPKWGKVLGIAPLDIAWIAASLGVAVMLADTLWLTPWINGLKARAAKIQEMFDTTVLGIPWNEAAVGEKPDIEDISRCCRPVRKHPEALDSLRNWYSPKLDSLPASVAVLLGQRSNLWWDADLRQHHASTIASLTVVLVGALLLVAIVNNLPTKALFSVVLAPSLPLIQFAVTAWRDNRAALSQTLNLKNVVNAAWQVLLRDPSRFDYPPELARSVQDQIYLNRKTNPLIPDWVYRWCKSRQEQDMSYSVESMIHNYEHSRPEAGTENSGAMIR